MYYTAFLGLRYLLRRRVSALATLLAVLLGVATQLTVLSIFEGYQVKLRELVRGLESHLSIEGYPRFLTGVEDLQRKIEEVPQVKATAPFVETVAMYRAMGTSFFQLKGIDLLNEQRVGDLSVHLFRPEELDSILPPGDEATSRPVLEERVQRVLSPDRKPLAGEEIEGLFSVAWRQKLLQRTNPGQPVEPRPPAGIVVGINVLLDRNAFLGDEVKVITLSESGDTIMKNFLVVGAFKSGEFETDSRAALVPIETLRSFLDLFTPEGEPKSQGIRIALHDYRHAGEARLAILTTMARDTADRWRPRIFEVAEKVISSFDEERIARLAAELQGLPGAQTPDPDEALSAVRKAVETLRDPALRDRARLRVEEAFKVEIANAAHAGPDIFGDQRIPLFFEQQIILEPIRTLVTTWEAALPIRGPAAKGSTHELEARRAVLLRAAQEFTEGIRPHLSNPLVARIRTWEDRQQILLQAVEREKGIVGFLVLLINVFIACLVLLMLVLLIIEKTRDIGVLLSLGATTRGTVAIFLITGVAIIALGTGLGLVGGYYFVKRINVVLDSIYYLFGFKLFDPETYKLDRLPTTVSLTGVLGSTLPAILFGLAASLIPAIWASRRDPIKAIHYE